MDSQRGSHTNLVTFYEEMADLADEEEQRCILSTLTSGRLFSTDSCEILAEKLMKFGLDVRQ